MKQLSAIIAATVAASLFALVPAAAADPEPIPPSCGETTPCDPPTVCDPQTLVALGQQIHQWRSRAEYLQVVVDAKDARLDHARDRIAKLRAKVQRLQPGTWS